MSKIQEIVSLESKNDDLISIITSTIGELDWMIISIDRDTLMFREKRRFDHFNHVEGRIRVGIDPETDHDVVDLQAWNNGIGTIQEEFLRGKISEFMLLFKDNLRRNHYEDIDGSDHESERSIAGEIEDLSRLYESGALSYVEFKKAKKRLLE